MLYPGKVQGGPLFNEKQGGHRHASRGICAGFNPCTCLPETVLLPGSPGPAQPPSIQLDRACLATSGTGCCAFSGPTGGHNVSQNQFRKNRNAGNQLCYSLVYCSAVRATCTYENPPDVSPRSEWMKWSKPSAASLLTDCSKSGTPSTGVKPGLIPPREGNHMRPLCVCDTTRHISAAQYLTSLAALSSKLGFAPAPSSSSSTDLASVASSRQSSVCAGCVAGSRPAHLVSNVMHHEHRHRSYTTCTLQHLGYFRRHAKVE